MYLTVSFTPSLCFYPWVPTPTPPPACCLLFTLPLLTTLLYVITLFSLFQVIGSSRLVYWRTMISSVGAGPPRYPTTERLGSLNCKSDWLVLENVFIRILTSREITSRVEKRQKTLPFRTVLVYAHVCWKEYNDRRGKTANDCKLYLSAFNQLWNHFQRGEKTYCLSACTPVELNIITTIKGELQIVPMVCLCEGENKFWDSRATVYFVSWTWLRDTSLPREKKPPDRRLGESTTWTTNLLILIHWKSPLC